MVTQGMVTQDGDNVIKGDSSRVMTLSPSCVTHSVTMMAYRDIDHGAYISGLPASQAPATSSPTTR